MDDLISRQDAIDALMNDSDWADAIPTIKSLPSADRPTGKWVFVEEFMGINRYKCSACEREELRTHLSNFCPNCGADMRNEVT